MPGTNVYFYNNRGGYSLVYLYTAPLRNIADVKPLVEIELRSTGSNHFDAYGGLILSSNGVDQLRAVVISMLVEQLTVVNRNSPTLSRSMKDQVALNNLAAWANTPQILTDKKVELINGEVHVRYVPFH